MSAPTAMPDAPPVADEAPPRTTAPTGVGPAPGAARRAHGVVRWPAALLLVVLATFGPIVAGYAYAGANAPDATPPLGPGVVTVKLDMRYSRFDKDAVKVYAGTLVRFEVTNSDPIHHELIVGPQSVHDAHEQGHDKFHPPVPGEVSVDTGRTGLTTYRFDTPGTVQFACHLHGHFAYGMRGTVTVVPLPARTT
jgi:plastocyanin